MKLQYVQSEMDRFGLRMARLIVEAADRAVSASAIVALCEAERVDMLTLRIPADGIALAQDLESAGFRLMDCLVYYEAQTAGSIAGKLGGLDIRGAAPADVDQIGEVARACFTDYFSHYHADLRLDKRLVADGYVDWARRSCLDQGAGSAAFAAIMGDRVVGIAALHRNTESEGDGRLFAVHPDFSGRGVHGALIDRAKQWCAENGMSRMVISTQLANLRAQRSYSNRGFRLHRSFFTFHRWFI